MNGDLSRATFENCVIFDLGHHAIGLQSKQHAGNSISSIGRCSEDVMKKAILVLLAVSAIGLSGCVEPGYDGYGPYYDNYYGPDY